MFMHGHEPCRTAIYTQYIQNAVNSNGARELSWNMKNVIRMVVYQAPMMQHQFHCCMHFSHGEYTSIFHGALHSSQRSGLLEYFVTHSRIHFR
jgi:hypothetical protein